MKAIHSLQSLGTVLAFCASLCTGVIAQELPAPLGTVVLTVSGEIAKKNGQDTASFDMAMLERLPQKTFTTQTPWYPQPVTFTGPLLRDLLNAVGAKGAKLTAVALNDYKTEIPASDAKDFDVVVARLMNGNPMPVRDKGPLFIVYPFDQNPGLNGQVYKTRSAWQLKQLLVK